MARPTDRLHSLGDDEGGYLGPTDAELRAIAGYPALSRSSRMRFDPMSSGSTPAVPALELTTQAPPRRAPYIGPTSDELQGRASRPDRLVLSSNTDATTERPAEAPASPAGPTARALAGAGLLPRGPTRSQSASASDRTSESVPEQLDQISIALRRRVPT